MKKIICKHCGSNEGFFIKTQIYGSVETYFNSNGTYAMEGENMALHDNLDYKYGKNIYCGACRRFIDKVVNVEKFMQIEKV
ncbi:hypothetical protein [Clostridium baratii]|uniref:hypothetical protein n=1 Tax=Clostridium baratii TaxID=1561 RepID=UPI0030D1A986